MEQLVVLVAGNLVIKSYVIYILPIAYESSIISSGIIYIGWSVIGCGLIYLITDLLNRVSWQSDTLKRQGIKQYLLFCLPSFIILGIMYAIYFPGTGTIDSTWLWQLIHENKFSDTHPLMLMIYYKFLTLLWDNYGVISLFQYLITVFTIGYAVNYFASKRVKESMVLYHSNFNASLSCNRYVYCNAVERYSVFNAAIGIYGNDY